MSDIEMVQKVMLANSRLVGKNYIHTFEKEFSILQVSITRRLSFSESQYQLRKVFSRVRDSNIKKNGTKSLQSSLCFPLIPSIWLDVIIKI